MSSDFGNDIITINDEDGNEFVLEHIDTIEHDDKMYMAFTPSDMSEDDEDFGVIILEVVNEPDGEVLVSVDDDDELDSVYKIFMNNQEEYE